MKHREKGSNLRLRGQSPPSCRLDHPGMVKRVTGFEPVLPVWKTGVLPLDDTRVCCEYPRRESNPHRPLKRRMLDQ